MIASGFSRAVTRSLAVKLAPLKSMSLPSSAVTKSLAGMSLYPSTLNCVVWIRPKMLAVVWLSTLLYSVTCYSQV
jgi:hypothetical protein